MTPTQSIILTIMLLAILFALVGIGKAVERIAKVLEQRNDNDEQAAFNRKRYD